MKIERCFLLVSALLIGCAREVTPVTDGGPDVPAPSDVIANDAPPVPRTAVLLDSCGPTDGPEVQLVVSTTPTPLLCVLPGDSPTAIVLTIARRPLAVGTYMATVIVPSVCDAGACTTAGAGAVTVNSYDDARSVAAGTYALTLQNGTTMTGTFTATICHNVATCG